MTNLSNATTEELQAHEAKLELINRIQIYEHLNRFLSDPNLSIKDVLAAAKTLCNLMDQQQVSAKAVYRDRELSLAESKVEVQRESLELARMKLAAKKTPPVEVEENTSNPNPSNPSNIIVPTHFVGKEVKSVNGEKGVMSATMLRKIVA